MIRRRFGRTEIQMPVITMGGMRFQKSWAEDKPEDIEKAQQENVNAIVKKALSLDVNHIETARGYGSSEFQLGKCIVDIPREKFILQSKVVPNADPEVFKSNFYKSLELLQVEYLDLLGLHGINNDEILDVALKTCIPLVRDFQKQGMVKHVGFSTHGQASTINKAIDSDEFDYVNLHYYYIDQSNMSCIEKATQRDMGIFIISPNDKGGKLYDPPQKLCNMVAPFTPMEFNNMFCLKDERIHTLSMGVSSPMDFDHHVESLRFLKDEMEEHSRVCSELNGALENVFPTDLKTEISKHCLDFENIPNKVNIFVISRLWSLAKAFDLIGYGTMRYNLIGNGGHWFPGSQYENGFKKEIEDYLKPCPFASEIVEILEECSDLFKGEKQKRLSQS